MTITPKISPVGKVRTTKFVAREMDKKLYSLALLIFCILISLPAMSQLEDTINKVIDEEKYFSTIQVDNPPTFIHPNFTDFNHWIFFELNKPDNIKDCIGNSDLNVSFTVTSKGTITDIIVRSNQTNVFKKTIISFGCQETIEKIVKSSSKYWIGGSNNGIPISVFFMFPIKFSS